MFHNGTYRVCGCFIQCLDFNDCSLLSIGWVQATYVITHVDSFFYALQVSQREHSKYGKSIALLVHQRKNILNPKAFLHNPLALLRPLTHVCVQSWGTFKLSPLSNMQPGLTTTHLLKENSKNVKACCVKSWHIYTDKGRSLTAK